MAYWYLNASGATVAIVHLPSLISGRGDSGVGGTLTTSIGEAVLESACDFQVACVSKSTAIAHAILPEGATIGLVGTHKAPEAVPVVHHLW
jgi:hypothetical protein